MPGETEVETPVTAPEVSEKKEIVEAENKTEEKKDEEKKGEEKEEKKEKAAKEKKAKKEAPPPPPPVHKKDFEKDVVYLYQFSRTPNVPSVSPYCLKVETWIKANGIKYENVNHGNKLRSKRGLLPFVEFNGEEIADSEFIIKTLSEKLSKDMDEGLTQEQKGVQHAMISMVDNHLNWCHTHWMARNVDNTIKGYKLDLQDMMGSKVPAPVLTFLLKHTYFRKSKKNVKAAGFGCYTDAEVDEMGKKDLSVLSEFLCDKQFFFGDDARMLDLKAFVLLSLLLAVEKDVECPLKQYVEEDCTNLVGMYNRMKDQAWGDHWVEATGDKLELNPHIPKPDPPKEEEKEEKKEEKKEEDKEKAEDKKEEKEKDNKEEEK
jgi:hypothetical protein